MKAERLEVRERWLSVCVYRWPLCAEPLTKHHPVERGSQHWIELQRQLTDQPHWRAA